MKHARKSDKRVIVAYAVMILAAVLFVTTAVSMIRNANAELNIISDEYEPDFEMYHIGVTLNENDNPIAWRNYQQNVGENEGDTTDGNWHVNGETSLFAELENVKPGVEYDEVLTVSNSGTIDEYVRVTIYKYWLAEEEQGPNSKNASDSKDTSLNPAYIILNLINLDAEHWILDEAYSTDERTVLYYAYPLTKSDGEYFDEENGTTVPFADKMMLDPEIATFYYQERVEENDFTTVTNYYLYDGKQFCVDIQVDGVQTHHADEAIQSAWGRKVNWNSKTGKISLKGE